MREWAEETWAEALEWCRGRSWLPRAILLAYLAYSGFRHITDREYWGLFDGMNFGVHELGHVVFAPLGEFLSVFGGTFWEVAVPVIAAIVFLKQPDFFGISVAGCWLSLSLLDVSRYMADARAQALPLVGLGPDPTHDWNFMLGRLGLLSADTTLAGLVKVLGIAIFLASVGLGGRLIWEMKKG